MANQFKAVKDPLGVPWVKEWDVDERSLRELIPWAGRGQVLERELEEMQTSFPLFIAAVASRNSITNCRQCGNLVVWKDGPECIGCGQLYHPPPNPQLAFIGQIPSIIGEFDPEGRLIDGKCRPVLEKILQRNGELPERERMAAERYIRTTEEGEYYFTPTVKCFYPNNWPRQAPTIMLEEEYFQILDIPREHAFPHDAGDDYALCIYSGWPGVTLRITLQQRIVPRIIIDLMLADLKALGVLSRVLSALGTSSHKVYNWIGKPGLSERFQEEYNRYVRLR